MHRPITGRLVIATHNKGKLAEMRELLARYGVEAVSAGELNLPEPEETGTTFAANARLKARSRRAGVRACRPSRTIPAWWSMRSTARPASIRRAGPGRDKDFRHAMEKVEGMLRERDAFTPDRRKAHFVSVLCVAWPDGHLEEFEGRVDGTLVWPPRGDKGFGYDPMFLPDGFALTFGEMSRDAKQGTAAQGPGAVAPRARIPQARGGVS